MNRHCFYGSKFLMLNSLSTILSDEKRRGQLHLAAVIIVGFLFRIILVKYRFVAAFDEINFLKLGVSGYLNGFTEVFHTYWSPLLPILISISCLFTDNYEFAARMVSIIAGSLIAIPVYLIAAKLYNNRVAIIAALFVAIFPPLVFQSTLVYTEAVYMLLAAFMVLAGLNLLEKNELRNSVIAGLLAGLLYLLHPQGIGFFIVMLFWIIVGKLFHDHSFSKMLQILITFVLAFVVISFPYLHFLKESTGVWTISAKLSANQQFEAAVGGDQGIDPFRTLDAKNETVLFDQIYHKGDFLQRSKVNPSNKVSKIRISSFFKKYIKNIYYMLTDAIPGMFTTFPMMLFGIGLLGSSWQIGQGKRLLFLFSFILFYWFAVIPAFHIIQRYLSPLWPFCSLFVANGAVQIYSWFKDYPPSKKFANKFFTTTKYHSGILLVAVFLILSFIPEMAKIVSRNPYDRHYWTPPIEQKIAGEWLNENAQLPCILMNRFQTVDFYAGNYNIQQSITIPNNELDRILAYAKFRGVNYLVINERYKKDNQKIEYLYDLDVDPNGLKQIYAKIDNSGYLTKIYQVL